MSHGKIVTSWQELKELKKTCVEVSEVVISAGKISIGLVQLLCRYGKSIPQIGGLLASVEGMLPAEDSEIHLLINLSEQIEILKRDIKELNNTIKLDTVKLQYDDVITDIKLGMKYLTKIKKSANDPERQLRHERRLVDFCSNELMTKAVEKLLNGLAPGKDSTHTDILETIYSFTGGHRGIMKLMGDQFLQLVFGGLLVIEAYERLVRGEDGVSDMQDWFESTAENLVKNFETYQKRCMDHFEKNMETDLEKEVLDTSMSNKDAVVRLRTLLQEKYDWLETYCIICNENVFIDYHFSGDYVIKVKPKGRFGVIFYRERPGDTAIRNVPLWKSRPAVQLKQVTDLIRDTDRTCWFSDAKRINSVLKTSLSSNGISVWGCATVKATRMISIPLINIPALIGSSKALNSFEISGTWTKAVSDVGGHKHLCLLK